MSKLNILFLPSDQGGVFYYRVAMAQKWLNKLDAANARIIFQEDFTGYDLLWADVIVMQRRHAEEELEGIIRQSRKSIAGTTLRKLFVYDTDDYLEGVAKSNPAYRSYHPGSPELELYRRMMEEADLLTLSTATLSNYYTSRNSRRAVLPNAIDLEDWQCGVDFPKQKKEVRIGFAGSASHFDDLKLIQQDLLYTLKRFPQVKLVIFGVAPTRVKNDLRELFSGPQVEFHNFTNLRNYPLALQSLKLDIGLAPLVDTKFNRAKSAIKYYEYTMAGAATIASKVGEYSEVITPERGMLVKGGDFQTPLKELILNAEARERLQKAALAYVTLEKSARKVMPIWANTYEKHFTTPLPPTEANLELPNRLEVVA